MHIQISDDARDYIKKKAGFYHGKGRFPKIVLASQSCRGAEFRLWFDFPQPEDSRIQVEDISIIIEKDLISKFGGFRLHTERFFFTTKVHIEPYNDIKECKCKK